LTQDGLTLFWPFFFLELLLPFTARRRHAAPVLPVHIAAASDHFSGSFALRSSAIHAVQPAFKRSLTQLILWKQPLSHPTDFAIRHFDVRLRDKTLRWIQ
jgi:hypothetical protein